MKQIAPMNVVFSKKFSKGSDFKGARLEGPVRQLLAQQREKLHSRGEGQQVVDRPTQQLR